jgi:hypothetical protein
VAIRAAAVAVFGIGAGWVRVRHMRGAPRFTPHNNFAAFIEDRTSRCAPPFRPPY